MGIYQDQILPRIQDKVMARKVNGEVRARVCSELRGDAVEIGFGTGLNITVLSAGSHKSLGYRTVVIVHADCRTSDRSVAGSGDVGGPKWRTARDPIRRVRRSAIDMDTVHDSQSHSGTRRDTPRVETRRCFTFCRAWARSGPKDRALAASS
jgi:hypothetical protein